MFQPNNKCYIHKPEYFLANETRKILWDFEKQTYNRISWDQSAEFTDYISAQG